MVNIKQPENVKPKIVNSYNGKTMRTFFLPDDIQYPFSRFVFSFEHRTLNVEQVSLKGTIPVKRGHT